MSRVIILICDGCGAREPLGDDPVARLAQLRQEDGWDISVRRKEYCPACARRIAQESARGRP